METAVSQALVAAGIKVYSDYVLAQWDLDITEGDERGEVTSVSFTSDSTPLTLTCVVSICLVFPAYQRLSLPLSRQQTVVSVWKIRGKITGTVLRCTRIVYHKRA